MPAGDVVMVGDVPVTLVHTPGHARAASAFSSTASSSRATPSSSTAAAGPTFPGATPPPCTNRSCTRLARVPDDTVLYPGHFYSPEPSATMGHTRAHNYVFRLSHPSSG